MRTYLKNLAAAAAAVLYAAACFASSPADSLSAGAKAQLQKRCEEFTGSLSFLVPESWDESSCEAAYFAYCEGWGVQKDAVKGLTLLQKGIDRGLFLPAVLLADVMLNGYHDTRKDFEAALKLYSRAYDLAPDDSARARTALRISDAYLKHSGSSFASYDALPWIRLYFMNGGIEENDEEMADILLQCEEEALVYDAGELIGEFKDGMIDYHKNYSGQTITVRGRVASVSKGTFSGRYTVKLLPVHDVRPLLPGLLSGIAELTDDDSSRVSSLLKKASKGVSLWNEYRNTVECVTAEAEAEALQTATVVMLKGTYALGTLLLPRIKDCELYMEPPIQAPEIEAPSKEKPRVTEKQDTPAIQI